MVGPGFEGIFNEHSVASDPVIDMLYLHEQQTQDTERRRLLFDTANKPSSVL